MRRSQDGTDHIMVEAIDWLSNVPSMSTLLILQTVAHHHSYVLLQPLCHYDSALHLQLRVDNASSVNGPPILHL